MEGNNNGMAIASLVLGILGLVFTFFGFGLILGIIAVVLGHIQKSNIKTSPEIYGGDGIALGGLITGYISIGIGVLSLLFLGGALLAILGIGVASL
tara:strand:- start:1043 stop:1330 length:288 start_codon:yes stop_codon:yes gene_type:complete